MIRYIFTLLVLCFTLSSMAQEPERFSINYNRTQSSANNNSPDTSYEKVIDKNTLNTVEKEVIAWRNYLHQNPELSTKEIKTAEYIVAELKEIGFDTSDITQNFASDTITTYGVIAYIRGKESGPTVALRADMDALPLKEYDNEIRSNNDTSMHACGHDAHVAMLLGAAKILFDKNKKDSLKGTVKLIFQPAEEGGPDRNILNGARRMVMHGVMEDVDVIFGIHVSSEIELNKIYYKEGALLSGSDRLHIHIKGQGAHASMPWTSVDPIVTSAQVILGLQTIISRQVDLTNAPAVISIGDIRLGKEEKNHIKGRGNIIPTDVQMIGSIRSLDTAMQTQIHRKIKLTAKGITESAGATAKTDIFTGYKITFNNEKLAKKMLPVLQNVVNTHDVVKSGSHRDTAEVIIGTRAATGSEDFSFYTNGAEGLELDSNSVAIESEKGKDGLFLILGVKPKKADWVPKTGDSTEKHHRPSHHTSYFRMDERAMILGVRTFVNLTIDYMDQKVKYDE